MPYLALSTLYCSISSGVCLDLSRGLSSLSRTKFLGISVLKTSLDRTFACSDLQGGHQSEPVNSMRMLLPSLAAWALAFSKSTTQPSSACAATVRDRIAAVPTAKRAFRE